MGVKTVAVVFGGPSPEHDVSIMSARSIFEALQSSGIRTIPVYWASNLEFASPEDSLRCLSPKGTGGKFIALPPWEQTMAVLQGLKKTVQVAFPVLHGPFGEDGRIQGLLDCLGIPYVGSGVLASALAMDKLLTKQILEQAGVLTAPFIGFTTHDWANAEDGLRTQIVSLGWPLFVKPSRSGSSIGISKVSDPDRLDKAIDNAFQYDSRIVVEKAIVGRELEVGILDGPQARTSVVGEIEAFGEFYDFASKYQDGRAKLRCPARINEEVANRISDIAMAVFKILDCRGLARVDFFWETATNRLYVNEVNTMPGFTPYSMYPLLWRASDIPYQDLVQHLLDTALSRY